MIRQLVLCVAIIGSQIAGQAICQCHAATAHDHSHAGVHDSSTCSPHHHHAPASDSVATTTDSPTPHQCDCHPGSPEFLLQRSFQLLDDVISSDCLTRPVTIAATISLRATDRSIFEYGTNRGRSSMRASLGSWLL